jgi:hypothetical protein
MWVLDTFVISATFQLYTPWHAWLLWVASRLHTNTQGEAQHNLLPPPPPPLALTPRCGGCAAACVGRPPGAGVLPPGQRRGGGR